MEIVAKYVVKKLSGLPVGNEVEIVWCIGKISIQFYIYIYDIYPGLGSSDEKCTVAVFWSAVFLRRFFNIFNQLLFRSRL